MPSVAEDIVVARNIMLAKYTSGKIHIAHISSADSVELIRNAKNEGINVTCEVTPHHFTLTDESLITYVSDRPGHDVRYAIDANKIARDLGWTPEETFETGMEKTINWYLENSEWCQHVLDGSYQGERLGLGDEQ